METIIKWSQGNPGAMQFLLELYSDPSALTRAIAVERKLSQCTSIRGTNLYVLYSDLCNRDLDVVERLCKNCPDDILEDACNRQDYSGRELVKEYI